MSDASADDLSRLGATSRTRAGMTIDPKWWKERTVEGLAREFRVSSGPHLFIDWRFVQAGLPGWLSRDGQPYGLRAPDDGPIAAIAGRNPRTYAGPQDVPEGIRLVAQAAGKSDPFDGPPGMLVLYDDGQYHTWNDGGYFQSPAASIPPHRPGSASRPSSRPSGERDSTGSTPACGRNFCETAPMTSIRRRSRPGIFTPFSAPSPPTASTGEYCRISS